MASVVAIVSALVVGVVNGVLVVVARVNTIVVTLGMSTLLLGISLWMSNDNTVSGLPSSFSKIALYNIGGLPISFYYGVALVAIITYALGFTPLGRHMQFVGASREVSRLSGVRVNRIRFGSFVFASCSRVWVLLSQCGTRWLQRNDVGQLPVAGVRGGLPRHRDDRSRSVQPDRNVHRHLLPRNRNPWPSAAWAGRLGVAVFYGASLSPSPSTLLQRKGTDRHRAPAHPSLHRSVLSLVRLTGLVTWRSIDYSDREFIAAGQAQGEPSRSPSLTVIAGMACLALLAACGSSSSSPSSSPSASDAGAAGVAKAQQMVTHTRQARRIRGPQRQREQRGFAEGSHHLLHSAGLVHPDVCRPGRCAQGHIRQGWRDCQICDGKTQPSAIAACVQQAVAANAAGMILDAIPYGMAQNALDSAKKRHSDHLADQVAPAGTTLERPPGSLTD